MATFKQFYLLYLHRVIPHLQFFTLFFLTKREKKNLISPSIFKEIIWTTNLINNLFDNHIFIKKKKLHKRRNYTKNQNNREIK